MGRRTLTHILISITSSTVAHGGTILVFFALMGSLSVWLSPPPSGVDSIELEMSIDRETAATSVGELNTIDDPHQSVQIEVTNNEVATYSIRRPHMSPFGKLRPPLAVKKSVVENLSDNEMLVQHLSPRASQNDKPAHDSKFETEVARPSRTATSASISSRRNSGVQTDTLPTKIDRLSPPPIYPRDALARRMEGSVDLRIRVDSGGRVVRVSVYRSSGFAPFDEAAKQAVRQWGFQPARVAGIAVTKEVVIGVNFVIGR